MAGRTLSLKHRLEHQGDKPSSESSQARTVVSSRASPGLSSLLWMYVGHDHRRWQRDGDGRVGLYAGY